MVTSHPPIEADEDEPKQFAVFDAQCRVSDHCIYNQYQSGRQQEQCLPHQDPHTEG